MLLFAVTHLINAQVGYVDSNLDKCFISETLMFKKTLKMSTAYFSRVAKIDLS